MKFLMCPPLYFRNSSEERERALSQWRALYLLLRNELQVDVELLEPRAELPGLVYVGRGGFVAGDIFVAGSSRDPSAEAESGPIENFFLVRGYEIKQLGHRVRFEGHRDIASCNGTFFTGFHRGDMQPPLHEELEALLGTEVVGLEFADHWQRPLASGLCPVGEDRALFCPSAFTDEACRRLESRIAMLVPVDAGDGGSNVCDSLIVGKEVIVAEHAMTQILTVRDLGVRVHELPLDEFSEEGGPRMLALQLTD